MDSARFHFEPCVRKVVAQFIKIDESSENITIVMIFQTLCSCSILYFLPHPDLKFLFGQYQ